MRTFQQHYPIRVGYTTFMRIAHDLNSIVLAHHKRCTCVAFVAETAEATAQIYLDKKMHNQQNDLRSRYVRGAFSEDIWSRASHVEMVWEDLPRKRPVRVTITLDRALLGNTIHFSIVGVSKRAFKKIYTTFGRRTMLYRIVRTLRKK